MELISVNKNQDEKRVSPSGLTFFLSDNSSVSAATDEIDHPFTFEFEEGDADGTEGHARFGNYLAGGLAFVRTGETIDYFLLFWR